MAAQLSGYLKNNGYNLTVVGLPKTVDNDVYPISQTLGHGQQQSKGLFFLRILSMRIQLVLGN